jgi:GT2 family glycosyltransferase/glycosyltransferase involved in cell wall biosynthesis
MHILTSFCNLRAPGVPALGLLNAATLEFQVLRLPRELECCHSITGLALCDRYVYAAGLESESSSVLFIFNRSDFALARQYTFRSGSDIHSLLARNGRLYAVSTGTDDIIELRLRKADVVSEVCYWRPDRNGVREDIHHLNTVSFWHDEILVSAFGKKASPEPNSPREGFIAIVSTGARLAVELNQPHSLAALGEGLAYCESRRRAVRVIGDDRIQHLPGYTRGLCTVGDGLFVGTSLGRQFSRSTGLINNPADDGLLAGQCSISRLSIATFEVELTVDLGAQAHEIYDLLPVQDATNWPVIDEISWRNSSIRELSSLLDQRTKWAKQSSAELQLRDATIGELQSQVQRSDALRKEVGELRTALDRQTAQETAQRRSNEALHQEVAELRTRLEIECRNNALLVTEQNAARNELQSQRSASEALRWEVAELADRLKAEHEQTGQVLLEQKGAREELRFQLEECQQALAAEREESAREAGGRAHRRAVAIEAGYGYFDNGVRIPHLARDIYLGLGDDADRFGDPVSTVQPGSFFAWLNEIAERQPRPGPKVSRFWMNVYERRPDLQRRFAEVLGRHRDEFLEWVIEHGAAEYDAAAFLSAPAGITKKPTVKPDAHDEGNSAVQILEHPWGVNLAGFIRSEKGVGEGVRSDIRFLEAAGIPYVLNDVTDPGSHNQDRTFEKFAATNPYAVNLIHVNADVIPHFVQSRGRAYLQKHYNIAYWAWELSGFPREWLSSFSWLDEVWAPSNFAVEAIARVSPLPVVRIPHCLPDMLPIAALDRSHFELPPDKCIFLFIFDFHSYIERKNPVGLIHAFRKAFATDDDAMLVIKCSRSAFCPEGMEAMRQACDGANVKIIDRIFSREEVNSLIWLTDCYVSLHRSEGFGLTMAEAMSLGKPVIATAYSGNMDFMTASNSFLVRWDPLELDKDHGPYKKGQIWANPDLEHAAEMMRLVYADRQRARTTGARAQQDIRRNYSPEAVGKLVSERLTLIERRFRQSAVFGKTAVGPDVDTTHFPAGQTQTSPEDEKQQYRSTIRQIRDVVNRCVSADATVIVVSKGDDELLQMPGRHGWHFPQADNGAYAGYHPRDSAAAIAHLETLRLRGGEYLLFPSTAFWWLEHYAEFRQHLDSCYQPVCRDESCVVYALRGPTSGPAAPANGLLPLVAENEKRVRASCSIIIPVFNKASLTDQCLSVLLSSPPHDVDCEIIVVDDASTDLTQSVLRRYRDRIRVVRHEQNVGFAAACNDGAAVATRDYLLFLNNDTIPRPGWLDALVRYAQRHPHAGIIGSKLLFPNDTIQHAGIVICQDGLPRHIYTGFPAEHPAVNKSRRFRAVTGACILIARGLFFRAGRFDTTFVNSFEDVDLCFRLADLGFESHYCHESVLYHLESVTRQGRTQEEQRNVALYRERWERRATPDDLQYYVEDGLLAVRYEPLYPLPLEIAPALGVIQDGGCDPAAHTLILERSRQVLGLMKDNIRLNVRIQELELQASVTANGAMNSRPARFGAVDLVDQETQTSCQTRQDNFGNPEQTSEARIPELYSSFLQAQKQLLTRDEELQIALAQALESRDQPGATTGFAGDQSHGLNKYLHYRRMIEGIRQVVEHTLPPDATILVVSKGDDELLRLGQRQAYHFPQGNKNGYLGYHPADSACLIEQLEQWHARTNSYLVLPKTSFWWLDHYAEFRRHLEQYQLAACDDDVCRIYSLATIQSTGR